MPESADVLDRTDALIQRRRSFVATRPAPTPTPAAPTQPLPAAPPEHTVEDEDLPVLTEVVSPEAAVSEPKNQRLDETQITLLAAEIAHAFAEQLANELPALLETALLQTSKNLRTGLSSIMESALREFLVRRRQLHLPLERQQDPSE